MSKQCLECSDAITGRADKKFCTSYCRSSYNNRLNSDSTSFIRNINNTLRKNRRILATLNPQGKTKISQDKLLERGFKFSYFTNIYRTKTGNVYYFCYDQGYLRLKDGTCTLVVRQSYVDG